MDLRQLVVTAFRKRFNSEPDLIVRAPGRVNLLGEHVDYNEGFVLPVAIDRDTMLACRSSKSPISTIMAIDMGTETRFSDQTIIAKNTCRGDPLRGWELYPAGMQWSLNSDRFEAPGMDAVFSSSVPRAAGLSSSASVEMVFGIAWEKLAGWNIPPMRLAQIGQRAENQYVGVNCGIMDQFASACGVKDRILFLDCRSLMWQTFGLPQQKSIVIANTTRSRSLAGSAYNDRRSTCEEAVRILKKYLPEIQTLRDVSPDEFNQYAGRLPDIVKKRAAYIVGEIERTRQASKYIEAGDLIQFGRLMNECHIGLRDQYEVSSPELDAMTEVAWGLSGCYGARLTGAGFGGCTVNLVAEEATNEFSKGLAEGYFKRTGIKPDIYICRAENGAGVLE